MSKGQADTTTTPVYPESSVLKASSTSSAKLQLSDIRPVDIRILERIKNLEISLEQHRDSEGQFQRNILSTQQDLARAKEQHEKHMQASKAQLQTLRRKVEELNAQSQENNNRIQELLVIVKELDKDRGGKEAKLAEIKDEIKEMMEHKEKILREREETEKEGLEYVRKKKEELLKEYLDILKTNRTVDQYSDQLLRDYGPEKVEALREQVRAKDARITELMALVEESESTLMVEEKIADDLVRSRHAFCEPSLKGEKGLLTHTNHSNILCLLGTHVPKGVRSKDPFTYRRVGGGTQACGEN